VVFGLTEAWIEKLSPRRQAEAQERLVFRYAFHIVTFLQLTIMARDLQFSTMGINHNMLKATLSSGPGILHKLSLCGITPNYYVLQSALP